jgi:hypothetical protein
MFKKVMLVLMVLVCSYTVTVFADGEIAIHSANAVGITGDQNITGAKTVTSGGSITIGSGATFTIAPGAIWSSTAAVQLNYTGADGIAVTYGLSAGSITISGESTFTGAVVGLSTLDISDAVNIGSATVNGFLLVKTTAEVTGASLFTGAATFTGASTHNGGITCSTITAGGTDASIKMASNVDMSSATCSGTFGVTGITTFNSDVNISSTIYLAPIEAPSDVSFSTNTWYMGTDGLLHGCTGWAGSTPLKVKIAVEAE